MEWSKVRGARDRGREQAQELLHQSPPLVFSAFAVRLALSYICSPISPSEIASSEDDTNVTSFSTHLGQGFPSGWGWQITRRALQ